MRKLATYLTRSYQKTRTLACAIAIGMLFASLSAWAQSGAGRIQGTITDASGSVIPNAAISFKNIATGEEYRTNSNSTGFYSAPSLIAGNYTITIDVPGMAEYQGKIELYVGQTVVVDPKLTTATVTQQVTVAADVVSLATYSDQTVSTTLESNRINQLPLNGRNITTLVGETTPGIEGQSANGNESNGAFEYVQDGAVLQDRDQDTVMRLPDQDSIQEVRVETSNSSAKFNRPATAILTTKSGTNAYHGTAFETVRNNAFGIAKNRQDTYSKAPQYVRNEFGFSMGGPVVIPRLYNGHNKTFFFAAYERYAGPEGKLPALRAYCRDAPGGLQWSGRRNHRNTLRYLRPRNLEGRLGQLPAHCSSGK